MADAWADDGGAEPDTEPGRLPEALLAAGAVAALASLLAFAVRELAVNITGYALGSLLTFSLVALSRRQAAAREFRSGVALSTGLSRAGGALLVVGLLAAIGHAYLIARHYA